MSDEYNLSRAISLVKELRAANKWETILLSTEAFEEIASNFIYVYDDREKWIVIEKRIPLRLTSQLEAFGDLNAFEFFLTLIEQGRTCKEASQDVLGILRRCDGPTVEEVRLREELEAVKKELSDKQDQWWADFTRVKGELEEAVKERNGWREGCLLEAEQHGKIQTERDALFERVNALEGAMRREGFILTGNFEYIQPALATLSDRTKGLVEALEHYAGKETWRFDSGQKARTALAEYRGGK